MYYSQSLQINPNDPNVHFQYANFLEKHMDDYNLALYHYQHSLQLNPSNEECRQHCVALLTAHFPRRYRVNLHLLPKHKKKDGPVKRKAGKLIVRKQTPITVIFFFFFLVFRRFQRRRTQAELFLAALLFFFFPTKKKHSKRKTARFQRSSFFF